MLIRIFLIALALLAAGPAAASRLLFVTAAPVQAVKFRLLAELGRAQGVEIEARYVEKLGPDEMVGLFSGYDAVFFDTPRDNILEAVRGPLARTLDGLRGPRMWLHEKRAEWDGIPDDLARRLHGYFINGGRTNFEGFVRTWKAYRAGQAWADLPPPVVFPKAAVYHPRAPGLVFENPAAYFAWKGVDPAQRPPVIGIAFHQAYLASEQTAVIHDLIERIEAGGAIALPFYASAVEQASLREMTRIAGEPVVDVLINTQITLDPEGRRREYEALGVPVVQAMTYRKGDEAAWRADPQGVALMDVPFYLAQAEYAGVADIQVVAAREADDRELPIPAQAAAVVGKALKLATLRTKPARDKQVAIFFWNYPPGEKNLSASYLNLPRSLEATLGAMKAAGYTTEASPEPALIGLLQQTLAPFYREGTFEPLLRNGMAELFPVAEYSNWLATLPQAVQRKLAERFGAPERSAMTMEHRGARYFVIPRARLGNIVVLPQPPRGEAWEDKEKALYHNTNAAPSHFYLAAYLWARTAFAADAIVHYGTHGSQEWLPGKERGLSASEDFPMLAVGDVPVVYPYIVDNIGEAVQAKRRGRAVTVTHQTPPFRPAGLHDALVRIHDLLHAWLAQDDGAVKERLKADFLAAVSRERIDRDLGWDAGKIAREFPAFVTAVHDQLHELARTAQPLGLHTFGRAPAETHRLATVLAMLGKPYWEAVAGPGEEADEMLVEDYSRLTESAPYTLLRHHVVLGEPVEAFAPTVRAQLEQGRAWYAALGAEGENAALLRALDGQYIPTSYGGDPMKNPDALPTGRNLYGFDPSRVPSPQAWEAGKAAAEQLIAAHREKTGRAPKKLAFSLWSVETMRHHGLLEAQALWTLGVEPVWDRGGRVVDVKLVPREALGRPRVDAVLSATGLYRDHFPNAMKILAKAAELAARAEEADNPVAAHSREIAARLVRKGVPEDAARKAAETRIFSSETDRYGTGLDDATLATDTWRGKREGDRKLARLYLDRMQFAFGSDEAEWGAAGSALAPGVNLYAEHLKGTEGAVLSRTSNLYGMLTTDDPFQYLGGIALAVRELDGKAPELYISNLRGAGSGKVESADAFLAKELATRNFHPGYIQGLMQEGYAGTLQVLDATNNFWGWTAVAREIVRDDQWQEFVDVYVRDKHRLGLKNWFERHNPHALAQTIERMLEAARQGYWKADAQVVEELRERYRDLAQRFDVRSDNAAFTASVTPGFGLDAMPAAPLASAAATVPPETPAVEAAPPAPPLVTGQRLERVEHQPLPPLPWARALMLALIASAFAAGALRQAVRPRTFTFSR